MKIVILGKTHQERLDFCRKACEIAHSENHSVRFAEVSVAESIDEEHSAEQLLKDFHNYIKFGEYLFNAVIYVDYYTDEKLFGESPDIFITIDEFCYKINIGEHIDDVDIVNTQDTNTLAILLRETERWNSI